MIAAVLLIAAMALLVFMFRADKNAAEAGEEGRYSMESYYSSVSFKLGLMALGCLIAFVIVLIA